MAHLIRAGATLEPFIAREVVHGEDLGRGARSGAVRRAQEWLNLQGQKIGIDGDFGPVTQHAVRTFQEAEGLAVTGVVDEETYARLVAPMTRVLQAPDDADDRTFGDTIATLLARHLTAHPLEVGGENRGPWVRLYMDGNEGPHMYWCAGFVTFVMKQAAEHLDRERPVPGSFGCDQLAEQGRDVGIFVPETDIAEGRHGAPDVGSVFLVRSKLNDWTHTGFVTGTGDGYFATVEGNTNDEGHRNGYEVCARTRNYAGKDFLCFGR